MAERRKLTDRSIRALGSAAPNTRREVWDVLVPGLGIRVTAKGAKTFVLYVRVPPKHHPARLAIGDAARLSLKSARIKAKRWLELVERGVDPRDEEERLRREEQRRRANSFTAVAEDYIRLNVIGPDPGKPRQRKGAQVAHEIRRAFMPVWGDRPITDIGRHDVLRVVEGVRDYGTEGMLATHGVHATGRKTRQKKRKGAPVQARNLLGNLKTLFAWAIERGTYGLDSSPCHHVSATRIVGNRSFSDRILSDPELRAFWRATGRVGYPWGPLYRLLLLSGLRLNEVAGAAWPEVDFVNALWTIPATRMKGTNAKARPHVVPLTPDMLAILEALPRFKKRGYLFSTTAGGKPVAMGSKVKARLDARMLHTLRALARQRGEDPDEVRLEHWVNHDLRRTLRSGLSKLRVSADVGEAILAHVKPGVRGVYDRYDLLDEKRAALELWAARLRTIVEPGLGVGNVVSLHGRGVV